MNAFDRDLNQAMHYFKELKANLFEFMFLTLKDDNSSFLFVCLLGLIQFLQSLFYFFFSEVNN